MFGNNTPYQRGPGLISPAARVRVFNPTGSSFAVGTVVAFNNPNGTFANSVVSAATLDPTLTPTTDEEWRTRYPLAQCVAIKDSGAGANVRGILGVVVGSAIASLTEGQVVVQGVVQMIAGAVAPVVGAPIGHIIGTTTAGRADSIPSGGGAVQQGGGAAVIYGVAYTTAAAGSLITAWFDGLAFKSCS